VREAVVLNVEIQSNEINCTIQTNQPADRFASLPLLTFVQVGNLFKKGF
jgi:hypothetical protein